MRTTQGPPPRRPSLNGVLAALTASTNCESSEPVAAAAVDVRHSSRRLASLWTLALRQQWSRALRLWCADSASRQMAHQQTCSMQIEESQTWHAHEFALACRTPSSAAHGMATAARWHSSLQMPGQSAQVTWGSAMPCSRNWRSCSSKGTRESGSNSARPPANRQLPTR
jgi:hypothetical protein